MIYFRGIPGSVNGLIVNYKTKKVMTVIRRNCTPKEKKIWLEKGKQNKKYGFMQRKENWEGFGLKKYGERKKLSFRKEEDDDSKGFKEEKERKNGRHCEIS